MSVRINQRQTIEAFRRLGLPGKELVTVITDLTGVGEFEEAAGDRERCLAIYLECLREAAGRDLTMVMPTFTYVRKGPGSPYEHESSPSETGALSEFVRWLPGTLRTVHPVFSFGLAGPESEALARDVSRFSYGHGSLSHRLIERGCFCLALGLSPHRGTFFIHVAETFFGVPYRYIKQLPIPVYVRGELDTRAYYHCVKYLDSDIVWDTNRLIERMENRGQLRFEPLGAVGAWSYRADDLFETTLSLLGRNPFGLLAHVPTKTPWTR